jgi:dTMP kinase
MMFISFEGIDFSGKSTQCQLLQRFLESKGFDVLLLREPGGTKISEKIRDLLLDKENDNMRALTEFLLYSASRAQLVDEVIKPALMKGQAVICDRYADSSTAYQGCARDLGVEMVERINRIATYNISPDLTIFVDIPVVLALERLKNKGKLSDRIEAEGSRFFELVRQGYLQIATRHKSRFKVVDGADDINIVERKIREFVVERFKIK